MVHTRQRVRKVYSVHIDNNDPRPPVPAQHARFRPFPTTHHIKTLHKVFESAPVDTSPSAAPVIAYCNGGVASTVALFLLFQLRQLRQGGQDGDGGTAAAAAANAAATAATVPATSSSSGEDDHYDEGFDGGAWGGGTGSWSNYDGSWNEWGNDESTPVER